MEIPASCSEAQHPYLPPGFRFHPTDEELVIHYLKRKVSSAPIPAEIITEIDLYKYDPWELPGKASFGEQEWYFFSPRDRKYPNGTRPNRAATSGYWKATGTDKPILASGDGEKVGVKKALVFYSGKPPKGIKTNWIMHEYRLVDSGSVPQSEFSRKKRSLRLDDWVLCRIYKKSASAKVDGDDGKMKGCNDGPFFDETYFDGGASASQLASPSCGSVGPQGYWMNGQDCAVGYRDVRINDQDYRRHSEDASSFGSMFSSSSFVGDGVLRHQYQLPNINWRS